MSIMTSVVVEVMTHYDMLHAQVEIVCSCICNRCPFGASDAAFMVVTILHQ